MNAEPAIEVRWYDAQKHIILVKENRTWAWNDFYTARNQINRMIAEAPHTVHMIIQITYNYMPSNAITHMWATGKTRAPNKGLTVLVGARAFGRMMYNLYLRVASKEQAARLRMAESMEEALAMIHSWDAAHTEG